MSELIGLIILLLVLAAPLIFCSCLIGGEIMGKERTFLRHTCALLLWSVFAVLCLPVCLPVLCIRRWKWQGGLLRTACFALALLAAGCLGIFLLGNEVTYETESLADYRIITGNYNDRRPQALIDSFFPAEIGEDFADPRWHYKAIRFDSVACEASLTFSLPEEAAFATHYASLARHGTPQPFPFDQRYEMWLIAADMDTWTTAERHKGEPEADYRNIESARVGLILCDREAHEFVYFALMVHDGGGTRTTDLNHFFTRFRVDPFAFEIMLGNNAPK